MESESKAEAGEQVSGTGGRASGEAHRRMVERQGSVQIRGQSLASKEGSASLSL